MKENLEIMRQQGMVIPVILGGAALSEEYVKNDCSAAYGTGHIVRYARDAFEALRLMDEIVSNKFQQKL